MLAANENKEYLPIGGSLRGWWGRGCSGERGDLDAVEVLLDLACYMAPLL